MSARTSPSPLWHAAHYNALAKEIRELSPLAPDFVGLGSNAAEIRRKNIEQQAILTTLALNLCHRFVEDNPNFDPLNFLEKCSPDNDRYPLTELWEDG